MPYLFLGSHAFIQSALTLPDISTYGPWIALAGVVVAAVALIPKFTKKKAKVVLKCTDASWRTRTETSIVTDVYITLLLQNKGSAATTINNASLEIEYKGRTYGPYRSE